MAIKKLQNSFTTPEQSKRLLGLGVPEDSADMMYYPEFIENLYSIGNGGFRMSDTPRVLRSYEKFSNSTHYDSGKFRELCTPCWSVGRLIEIYMIAAGLQWIDLCLPDYFTESIVKMFEGTKDLDFSKLEE